MSTHVSTETAKILRGGGKWQVYQANGPGSSMGLLFSERYLACSDRPAQSDSMQAPIVMPTSPD